MLTFFFELCLSLLAGATFAAGIRSFMPSFDHVDKHIARFFYGFGIIVIGLLGVVVYNLCVHGSIVEDLSKSAGILCLEFVFGFIGRCCWEFLSDLSKEQVGSFGEEPWFAL